MTNTVSPLQWNDKIKYEIKDGKVMIDLDALLNIMFEMCKNAGIMAEKVADPLAAIMALGATSVCEGIDTVYKLIREQEGLDNVKTT